ncbi:hypothetical protein [Streptomyces sp. NPDC016845]|uniref:hypothetical protein n=1 Tax=Streptomyces sp. NPDC016845 TaxID=3364972 RepID=UPI0037A30880
MSRTRRGLIHAATVLALTTAAAGLTTTAATAADRIDIVSATAKGDRVAVTVRYRCDALMGTDTLHVALADASRGGIYAASTTPTCDGKQHKETVSTARNAGPATAPRTEAVITASLGMSPDPQLFPTASNQVRMALHGRG